MTAFEPVELYVSDIHGEYNIFSQILRSAGGQIRLAEDDVFGDTLTGEEKDALATLVCYPEEKMALECSRADDADVWREQALSSLVTLYAALSGENAEAPADAASAIPEFARAIQHAAVKAVHMVGDIYDRGPHPNLAMEELLTCPNLDIQWGNHDMLWMGAALGQRGSVANAVRICARYGNLSLLEETYGIDLSALRTFANTVYADDPCAAYGLKGDPGLSEEERQTTIRIQKAMSYIQFKVEAQLIADNPSFGLETRNLLHHIDYEAGTVELDGVTHELLDKVFPTIDPTDPYRMTPEEEAVMDSLVDSFVGCEKLQRHMQIFLEKGSLYKICGKNLVFHACVPLNDDGSLKEVDFYGKTYKGRALFDAVDSYVRAAYKETDPAARKRGLDMLWYLWLGSGSPLFAKSKMATFELYLVADKTARKEVKNAFYTLYEDPEVMDAIFRDFGMDPEGAHMIAGHTPVKVKDGEDPMKAGGKVIIIDGGMSPAYQGTTGIAGMTIVEDSKGLRLALHELFPEREIAVETNAQMHSEWRMIP